MLCSPTQGSSLGDALVPSLAATVSEYVLVNVGERVSERV